MSNRTLKEIGLSLITFLLVSFSFVTSNYAAPIFDLGQAKPFTVLELGGKDLDISSSTVEGDIGKGIDDQGGEIKVSSSNITGSAFRDLGMSGVGSSKDMSAIVAGALAASNDAAGLTADQTLGDINSTNTFTGGGVFNITGDFILDSGSLVLGGGVGDYFVFNVSGDFRIISNSEIQLQGDITASEVLFNIMGSGNEVLLDGSDTFGTILAPDRALKVTSHTHTGALIGGSDSSNEGINISSSYVGYDPFMPTNPVVPSPEPSTMLLLGSGLAGLGWYRRRRKAAYPLESQT